MKSPAQVLVDVQHRLARTWAGTVTGTAEMPAWPHRFPLGQPTEVELTAGFAATAQAVHRWREWAETHQVHVDFQPRRVMRTEQELPTHLHVPDIDTAARLCGDPWPEHLDRARSRAVVVAAAYPHLAAPARVLTQVQPLDDVDFDLLCRAANWFATNDATGLTSRQVPIEGLHAKWLNTRRHLVRELAGVEHLNLLPRHPPRLHFTYLDPAYRATRGRVHDSVTIGDTVPLPYQPRVVVISENKDTAIHFPPVPGGISVEGFGRGGGTAAAVPWLRDAPAVFYWGDMDADGLEILNEFRAAGIPAVSLLMDCDAFTAWERFGTNTDARGHALQSRSPRPVPHLNEGERALYENLVSPTWTRHRRIEQERLPLSIALETLRARLRS